MVLVLGVTGVGYVWFRSQVAGANARVTPEIRVALTAKPSTTLVSTTTVAAPESPAAMNVLVLGSDKREQEQGDPGRSDTVMLVHVDPGQNYLSVLSLPRDLRVDIPGHGKNKLNYAYAVGGPALTIQTVEQLTGVDVNHYVEVDFQAFRDIVDALGGVYIDVDRRYYNDDPHYELIRLAPGYQLLDGDQALDFVRFRHDQNLDFGRMERQQMFLRAVKEQALTWDLPFKLPSLVSALFDNLATDLGANDILKLAYWAVRLEPGQSRMLTLTGATGELDGVSYVFVDKQSLSDLVEKLLTPPGKGAATATSSAVTGAASTSTSAVRSTAAPDLKGVEVEVLNANGRKGEASAAGEWLKTLGAEVKAVANAGTILEKTLVEYPAGALGEAKLVAKALSGVGVKQNDARKQVTVLLGMDFTLPKDSGLSPSPSTIPDADGWRAIARQVPYAVRAPAYLPEGYEFVERMPPTGATYDIKVGSGTKPAFKMLYRLKQGGKYLDQFMGITETTWLDAPAASKGKEVRRGAITYTVVGSEGQVDRVWFKADGVLYWVSNTLSHLLSEDELLAVATSMLYIPAQ